MVDSFYLSVDRKRVSCIKLADALEKVYWDSRYAFDRKQRRVYLKAIRAQKTGGHSLYAYDVPLSDL